MSTPWIKRNHDYLADYVKHTKDEQGDMTGSVTATIVQFLMNVKRNFNLKAAKNEGMLSRDEIILAQIEELKGCIIDLQQILNIKEEVQ